MNPAFVQHAYFGASPVQSRIVHPADEGFSPQDLYVVAVYSNPVMYRTRAKLFLDFKERMLRAGVSLVIVECTYGDRPYLLTDENEPLHFRVRLDSELWVKESLINYAVARLPSDWKYVAWVDADVAWQRDDWPMLTLDKLQHHPVVQMWQHAVDLGPNTETMQLHTSFGCRYHEELVATAGEGRRKKKYEDAKFGHPGYAWAMRRDAFEAVGGLVDFAIVGSGDHHMATAIVGRALDSVPQGLHPNYLTLLKAWETRAVEALDADLGFLPVTILHYFHGKKKDRGYQSRWSILTKLQFDPLVHVRKTWDGIACLSPQAPKARVLREQLRKYFRSRNEDSVDAE